MAGTLSMVMATVIGSTRGTAGPMPGTGVITTDGDEAIMTDGVMPTGGDIAVTYSPARRMDLAKSDDADKSDCDRRITCDCSLA
jgi:hypothetical protein